MKFKTHSSYSDFIKFLRNFFLDFHDWLMYEYECKPQFSNNLNFKI